MNILSLCDGMSCGRIALDRAGVDVSYYFASEIEKHAIKVARHNYPDTVPLGDIRNVSGSLLPPIDLLLGGTPCQGFSYIGKQLAFGDPRSALFFEYVRILEECRKINPAVYFLLENVRMKTEHRNVITEALGVTPVRINSALVSAQNRVRDYWTNIPGVAQPEDKGTVLADVLQSETGKEYFVRTDKHFAYIAKRLANTFTAISPEKALTLLTRDYANWNGTYVTAPHAPFNLRKLTPVECERLQTVPDNYTACVSNTQRYRMLGNGWTVDVIAHILRNINKEHTQC